MTKQKIKWKRAIPIYIMALPTLIYLIINNYIPMFGMIIAFKNLDFKVGILKSEWIGLENFKFLFRTKDAWTITRNTLLYNLVFIVLGIVIGVGIAICLNEIRSRIRLKIYQSIILIPYLMSWVVISYLVYSMLAVDTGFVNKSILEPLNVGAVNWYMQPKYWPVILTVLNIWKSMGFTSVMYYSSIIGIQTEIFEAAKIDGATHTQQIRYITLPLLKPTIITLALLNLGHIFNSDFGLFYQIPKNSGLLYSTTRTLDVYVYNALMNNNDYAMSSAASVYQSVVGFATLMIANGIIRKVNNENALF